MAVEDLFQLSAADWVDDDAPLTYRFSSGGSYLTNFNRMPSTSAILPAGLASQDYNTQILCEISDSLGAVATSSYNVSANPFHTRTCFAADVQELLGCVP